MGFEDTIPMGCCENRIGPRSIKPYGLCKTHELAQQESCPDELVCEALLLSRRALTKCWATVIPKLF